MRKLLLLVTTTIFASLELFAQIDTVSLQKLKLSGRVKAVALVTATAKDSAGFVVHDKITRDGKFKSDALINKNVLYLFDEKGNQVSYSELNNDLSIWRRKQYIHENNLIVLMIDKFFSREGDVDLHTEYIYNKSRQLISSTTIRNGSLFEKHFYEYDNYGNLQESREINAEGRITELIAYNHNDQGLMTYKKTQNNPASSLDSEYLYEYDSVGRKTNHTYKWHGGDARLRYYYVMGTFKKLRIVGNKNGTDEIGVVEDYIYKNDTLSKKTFTLDGVIYNTVEYFYDDGYVVEISHKDKVKTIRNKRGDIMSQVYNDGDITMEAYTYNYKYDSHNNWTEIAERKNTVPTIIKRRIIEYY